MAVLLMLVMAATGACQSTEPRPLLTDPQAIVAAAAASSASLATVHAQIDLRATDREAPRGQNEARILLEADIDVRGRAVAGRSRITLPGGEGNELSEFIQLDGTTFSRDEGAQQWSVHSAGGAHLPTTGAYVDLISRAMANGSATLALEEPVGCGERMCYHVAAALDLDATWRLLVGPIVGDSAGPDEAPRPDMVLVPATLELFVDQESTWLMGFTGSFGIQQSLVAVTVTFLNHDQPIRIAPPPAELLDGSDEGGIDEQPAEPAPRGSP